MIEISGFCASSFLALWSFAAFFAFLAIFVPPWVPAVYRYSTFESAAALRTAMRRLFTGCIFLPFFNCLLDFLVAAFVAISFLLVALLLTREINANDAPMPTMLVSNWMAPGVSARVLNYSIRC
jgi:hypothetical protein